MKVLAVSHEASATGAPIFFLTMLSWFRIHRPDWSIDIIIVKDGVIREQFERLGRNILLGVEPSVSAIRLAEFVAEQSYDLIYCNTLETAHILDQLIELGATSQSTIIVSHIHELEATIQKYGPSRIQVLSAKADHVIAVSSAVKFNLVDNHNFRESKIHVVNPCSRILQRADFSASDSVRINKLAGRKVILGCGEIAVGKGTDVFINTARALRAIYSKLELREDFAFIWLGPDSYSVKNYFDKDIELLNLNDVVQIFDHRDEVFPFFDRTSLFYMSSRQDSFPLVCLEALSLKIPIIYFPDAGGIKEFLSDEYAFPQPYLDAESAAQCMFELIRNPAEGIRRATAGYSAWDQQYSSDSVCERILKIIGRY
ncbi:MAG: glycosyltransferase [Proteobacteria bacterium]|nr:MAG: glycosyltransferase [Pseudomonadota bacterium]